MKKNELNKIVLREMKNIYYKDKTKPYIDWMGYPITPDNKPSYHHIIKSEVLKNNNQDSTASVNNGAYLGKRSHEKLHQVELLDKELYEAWNYIFFVINKMGIYPIDDVMSIVISLQKQTEKLLYEENNQKRKLL